LRARRRQVDLPFVGLEDVGGQAADAIDAEHRAGLATILPSASMSVRTAVEVSHRVA